MFSVQIQKHIRIKVHEDYGYGLAMPADYAVLQFQFMGCHERTGQTMDAVKTRNKVLIFQHIFQGLFLGNYSDQTGIWTLLRIMRLLQHTHKTVQGMEQVMIKVQMDIRRVFPDVRFPDRLANNLCDPLIVPTSGASQVPFRMISKKLIQAPSPFRYADQLRLTAGGVL